MQNIHLIIPAAGERSGMESTTPKQFSNFHGKTILEFVESIFSKLVAIKTITVALNKNQKYIESLGCQFSKKISLTDCGGSTRSETVLNTLEIIGGDIQKEDWIMVHDAARVGITESLVILKFSKLPLTTFGDNPRASIASDSSVGLPLNDVNALLRRLNLNI